MRTLRTGRIVAAIAGGICMMGLAVGVTTGANGIIITAKSVSGGTTETHQIQMDADHLRADTGDSKVLLFDGAKQVLEIVNTDQKTYRELTKADVDRLGAQVSGAMAQMQSQMANLPPEQRARIEAMMKGRGMNPTAAAATKPEYRKVGTDKVGKWTCEKYDVYESGQKAGDVCTVSPSVLGVSESDLAVTKQMQAFFAALLKFAPGAQANQMFTFAADGLSGIPVRRTQANGDVMELSDIMRANVPESAFQVPAGFQKQPFMGARGGQ